MPSTAGGL
jgi:hypothetical protein